MNKLRFEVGNRYEMRRDEDYVITFRVVDRREITSAEINPKNGRSYTHTEVKLEIVNMRVKHFYYALNVALKKFYNSEWFEVSEIVDSDAIYEYAKIASMFNLPAYNHVD